MKKKTYNRTRSNYSFNGYLNRLDELLTIVREKDTHDTNRNTIAVEKNNCSEKQKMPRFLGQSSIILEKEVYMAVDRSYLYLVLNAFCLNYNEIKRDPFLFFDRFADC